MKFFIFVFLVLIRFSFAQAFDESMNYQPGLNLFEEAAKLTDLIGPHGS